MGARLSAPAATPDAAPAATQPTYSRDLWAHQKGEETVKLSAWLETAEEHDARVAALSSGQDGFELTWTFPVEVEAVRIKNYWSVLTDPLPVDGYPSQTRFAISRVTDSRGGWIGVEHFAQRPVDEKKSIYRLCVMDGRAKMSKRCRCVVKAKLRVSWDPRQGCHRPEYTEPWDMGVIWQPADWGF